MGGDARCSAGRINVTRTFRSLRDSCRVGGNGNYGCDCDRKKQS